MQQNALIQIKGIQYQDDDNDIVELTTVGSFFKRDGAYYIRYEESEATGFEGNRTTLKVEENRCVTMQRTGTAQSQLIIEKGQRHQCLYNTGYGDLVMGVSCDKITSSLGSDGGKLHFKYTLDLNASMASQNEVFVVVQRTDALRRAFAKAAKAGRGTAEAPVLAEAPPAGKVLAEAAKPVAARPHTKDAAPAKPHTGAPEEAAQAATAVKDTAAKDKTAKAAADAAPAAPKAPQSTSRVHPVKKRDKAK